MRQVVRSSAMMPTPSIRPRFELLVNTSAEATLACIEARIEGSAGVRGWVSAPYAELRVRPEDRFVWSPRLAIHAEDTAGGTQLSCRIQPEPDTWTAYLACWAVVGTAGVGALVFGASQWVIGSTPWSLIVGLPVVAVLCIALTVAAHVGQQRGAAQIWLLERELDAALRGVGPRLVDPPIDDLPRARGFGSPRPPAP